jgi:hypothetical protein
MKYSFFVKKFPPLIFALQNCEVTCIQAYMVIVKAESLYNPVIILQWAPRV